LKANPLRKVDRMLTLVPIFVVLWLAQLAGPEQKLLRVEEAARRLGIGRTKFYELIRDGVIPTVTLGTMGRGNGETVAARRLVPVEAVDAYADSLPRETSLQHRPARSA
jgi:excisionase family DNA binding protein